MTEREKRLEEALQDIMQLCTAYPFDAVQEPDRSGIDELPPDAIAAHYMRQVIDLVARRARQALSDR
jgi:hypothetical protein